VKASPSLDAQFILSLGFPLQIVALHPGSGVLHVKTLLRPDCLAAGLRQCREWSEQGYNLYYEVNPGTAVSRRSKAGDITHLRAVVGDADAKAGRSIEDCLASVATLPLPPSFVISTGGGVHTVYLIAVPAPVSADATKTYEDIGRSLQGLIDGDAVFDLPRMMRLPGFINWPTASKQASGRSPAMARVLTAKDRRYTLPELAEAFTLPTSAPKPQSPLSDAVAGGLSKSHWFDQLHPEAKDACLAEMLAVPSVAALADTSDGDPAPNWRTVLAACARSGAPKAYDTCRAWAETSPRFSPQDFDARWRSYANG
jgi:hypothetical protein